VNSKGEADEIRQHGGTATPGLDDSIACRFLGLRNLLAKGRIDKWPFTN
jgi:hypothetical protein